MQSRMDPEDVVQSVFRTFFARMKNDEFKIDAEDDLFKLLVRITVHKALRQIAHHRAAKRDPMHEAMQGSDADDMLRHAMIAEADARNRRHVHGPSRALSPTATPA